MGALDLTSSAQWGTPAAERLRGLALAGRPDAEALPLTALLAGLAAGNPAFRALADPSRAQAAPLLPQGLSQRTAKKSSTRTRKATPISAGPNSERCCIWP